MKQKLVSIILPVYNVEEFIAKTINSIKEQTYKNWELIIINDGSTDNSINIIKKVINNIDNNIFIIENEVKSGVSASRNKGIENAQGEFIAFIDGDDFWQADKLEKQVDFMQKNNYLFTYTCFSYLRDERAKKVLNFKTKMTYKKALKNTLILTSTVMIDIKEIDKKLIYMPNIQRGQDTATWWQILKSGYVAYGLNENLTFYRRRKKSLSINKFIALKRTWKLYRNVEKFSVIKSAYYFSFYLANAIIKRLRF